MNEETPCSNGHRWKGIAPQIDPKVLTEQNPQLVGIACDCGKFIYNTRNCGCSSEERELWLQDNPNYIG